MTTRAYNVPKTITNMSNIGEKLAQNEDLYMKYHEAQNKVKLQQEALANERAASILASLGKKTTKANNVKKGKSTFASTLSPAVNLRRYETVFIDDPNGERKKQRILQPLDEQTKYQHQWFVQASDMLNDEQRSKLNIALTKSQKTRMKQSAKTFCTTNNPIEELQRGSLVFTLLFIIESFWPFNPKLLELGMLEASSAFVLLQKIVPRDLLLLVFDKVFSAEKALRKSTSPTSKKKMPTKHEILTLKEADAVFSMLNTWLFDHLAKTEETKDREKQPFLQKCVNVLKENRTSIVVIFKKIEQNQCSNDAVDSYKKMVERVQEMTENVTMNLVNKSGRTKLAENIGFISKLNVEISRKQISQKAGKKQSTINRKSENPLSSNKRTFPIGEKTQMNENIQQDLKNKKMKFSIDPRNQKNIRKPNLLILPQKEISNCQKVEESISSGDENENYDESSECDE